MMYMQGKYWPGFEENFVFSNFQFQVLLLYSYNVPDSMYIYRIRLVWLFSVLVVMMMFIGYLGWKDPYLPGNSSMDSDNNFVSRSSSSTNNNASQNQKKVEISDGDVIRILDIINKMENKKPLLVTLINNAYLPFTYSWLCNTKDMDVHKQVFTVYSQTCPWGHLYWAVTCIKRSPFSCYVIEKFI